MSRHEGVSCDCCLKSNFRGRRYKCLICYDYDLCATCYENGATTTRHTAEHPMQCILTRSDFDLYYGGEAVSLDQAQSFTCTYCGKMGFTEATLQEHVTSEHSDANAEVVCPVCAASPGGDPNHVTDDFAAHLTLEHRSSREIDEAGNVRHLRRMFHPGRGIGPRPRRTNMHFSGGGLSAGQSSGSPGNREAMDPIAELLSQLSGARRSAGGLGSHSSTASQLHQLQMMQLQLERQQQQQQQQSQNAQVRSMGSRRQVESLTVPPPRRPTGTSASANSNPGHGAPNYSSVVESTLLSTSTNQPESQYLLSRINEPSLSETDLQVTEIENADRSFFIQDLILSTLNESDKESDTSLENVEGSLASSSPADGATIATQTLLKLGSLNLKEKEGPA
ncbi:E3 ubiquitin-protein ligase KCMF1-like [Diadema setosum]|uniref:E3 ubiquitin-protein ligase KCMF1-like n=1 Tax=Diadema setosum TaxID=31175 RepID=UPI003B3AECD8